MGLGLVFWVALLALLTAPYRPECDYESLPTACAEGVTDPLNRLTINGDNVETRPPGVAAQPNAGGELKTALFVGPDRLQGADRGSATALPDFNEDGHVALCHDEIDLTAPATKALTYGPQTVCFQVQAGSFLGSQPFVVRSAAGVGRSGSRLAARGSRLAALASLTLVRVSGRARSRRRRAAG